MNTKGELISLTLTNILNTDSEVNLFSFGNGGTSTDNTTIYYKNNFTFTSGGSYQVQYYYNSVFNNYFTSSLINNINDLILELNTSILGAYVLFSYETNGAYPFYTLILKILDNLFVPSNFRNLSIGASYSFSSPYIVQKNSTVVITTGTSISYQELMSELQNQPYIIDSVNIYANTQAQSLQRFRKTQKEANGVSLIEFERPKLDPMQNQFAIEGIKTKFTPSPLNALNYNMKGGQTVRIWLYYKMIDISVPKDIPPITKVLPTKKVEKMIIKQSINPFFDLMGITNVKRINIKEDIKKDVKLRDDITDEEVYNSFDGLDYKNIKK